VRERRRCPACGVSVPADAGRCATCGHEIGALLVVAVERQSPRGRRTVLAIGAGLALLVGVLAVVDTEAGDREEQARAEATTTTRERRTATTRSSTTTTAEVRPFTSPIAFSDGIRLFAWTASGAVDVVDPAAGSTRRLTLEGFPASAEFFQVIPRLGGVVLGGGNTGQAYWLPALDGSASPVPLVANVSAVFPSDMPGRVWVSTFGEREVVQELDIVTGQPTVSFPLPFDAFPQGAVNGGIIVGTQDGIYLRRRDADRFERLVHGSFVASSGDRLVYRACDDQLVCGLFTHDLVRGRSTPLAATLEGWPQWAAFSPDGRWVAISVVDPNTPPAGGDAAVQIIDLVSGAVVPVPVPQTVPPDQVAWTLDSQWLLWPESSGLRAARPTDGGTVPIELDTAYRGVAVVGPPA
jgi:hypothetical protein